jgi:biuret amidohydrolase
MISSVSFTPKRENQSSTNQVRNAIEYCLPPFVCKIVTDNNNPGKGAFYATDLAAILAVNNITTLLVCGVTTEVCVHTTVREANDRGKHCIVISDACASFFDEFHRVALEMITAQGGIFGSLTDSESVVTALTL